MHARNQRGFTVIEVMIVSVVLGLLFAVTMPIYNEQIRRAEMVKVVELMDHLGNQATAFYTVHGRWPDRSSDLYEAIGANTHYDLADGDTVHRVLVDDGDGDGQVLAQVYGAAINSNSQQWIRLRMRQVGGKIVRDWCDTDGYQPTHVDAQPYLPC